MLTWSSSAANRRASPSLVTAAKTISKSARSSRHANSRERPTQFTAAQTISRSALFSSEVNLCGQEGSCKRVSRDECGWLEHMHLISTAPREPSRRPCRLSMPRRGRWPYRSPRRPVQARLDKLHQGLPSCAPSFCRGVGSKDSLGPFFLLGNGMPC